ncbi:hypothetical protein RHGRI_025653 [Rhododendron griersonianum]|uniref:Uncharacterized protein n=1 Tax=Rhododendron griersonianum TaxID=479676 RepID=A0AAV6IQ27_9ERIC|nr:hypothetical protein RHGRI_025653 [Rhododendron griersonianum]
MTNIKFPTPANIFDMKKIGVATPTLQEWCELDANQKNLVLDDEFHQFGAKKNLEVMRLNSEEPNSRLGCMRY